MEMWSRVYWRDDRDRRISSANVFPSAVMFGGWGFLHKRRVQRPPQETQRAGFVEDEPALCGFCRSDSAVSTDGKLVPVAR